MNEIPGNAGIGITIPVNEYSRAIFGNPERFEKYAAGNDRRFENVSIRYDGVLLIDGVLIINSADKENYNCWLQSWIGATGDEQRDKYINELEWDDTTLWDNKIVYLEAIDDYCMAQVHNHRFWEGKGKEAAEDREITNEDDEKEQLVDTDNVLTQQFREGFEYLVNRTNYSWPVIDIYGKKSTQQALVVSPFLFFHYALKEILRMLKWFVDDDNNCIKDMACFANLFIYNNFNICTHAYTKKYTNVTNFNTDTLEYEFVTIEEITGVVWRVTEAIDYADLVPRIALKDFILGLQNYLNIVFHFRDDKRVSILDRDTILKGDPIDLDEYFMGDWMIGEKKDVTLKFISEYDPDDSMMGDEWHDLSDRRADFADPVDTYEDLEAITTDPEGTIRRVKATNKYYEWKWSVHIAEDHQHLEAQFDILAWEFLSNGPQHYFFGDGDEIEEIKTGISSPIMGTVTKTSLITITEKIEVPVVLQKGNVCSMRSLWNDFAPRLLFYHTNASAKTKNIYATAEYLDEEKALELDWYAKYGLIEKRWKNWARFWSTRLPVEGRFMLPMNMISYVKNNITSKFRTRHGEFIIEEMETEFAVGMVGVTHIKGFKV